MRRSQDPISTEIAELTRTRQSKGRKFEKNLANLWKMSEVLATTLQLRYQSYNPFAGTNCGKNKLYWHRNTAGYTVYPMHVYCLNGIVNNTVTVSSADAVAGTMRMATGALTATLDKTFANAAINGITIPDDSAGNPKADYSWDVADTGGGSTAPLTTANAGLFQWADIRLLCFGRSTLPTRYTVAIVKSNDPDLTMEAQRDPEKFTTLLQNMIQPYCLNPILPPGAGPSLRDITVVMKEDFLLGSVQSNEGDTIPHMKNVKLFFKPNQMQRYDWEKQGRTNENIANDEDYPVQVSYNQNYPDPRARYYLVIMAGTSYTTSAVAPVWTAAANPSYDIVLRTQHKINGA